MDPSPLFDPTYLAVVIATLVGFGVLAALLLVPVYRFLEREQEVAEKWTPEAVAKRLRERKNAATNGTELTQDDERASAGRDDEDASTPA